MAFTPAHGRIAAIVVSAMAYRFFLDLALHSSLPHHTLLTYLHQRLGVERHQQIFAALAAIIPHASRIPASGHRA